MVQQEILRVFIRGRENVDEDDNAFFPGKYLKCRIEFWEDYPENPPKFYIEKLKNGDAFRSMNVYADGEVCQYTLNPDYWAKKKYDLCTIVKSVESMLYSPNSSDPANLIMQELFSENENQYWQIQASQAKNFYDESDLKSWYDSDSQHNSFMNSGLMFAQWTVSHSPLVAKFNDKALRQ